MAAHPRNRHLGRYDFPKLIKDSPSLAPFVRKNKFGDLSIDFADPEAVRTLNQALLMEFYGIKDWNIPPDYLCPPIPGRSDYIHLVADLISAQGGKIPLGPTVRALDVGVGASAIYPIIGHSEYGWSFVGVDTDPVALESARRIVDSNSNLKGAVELRLQPIRVNIFKGVMKPGEKFDIVICNPPFHTSLEEARAGSRRKWNNLGKTPEKKKGARAEPVLNFGGQDAELWCPGGESEFISRMIEDSATLSHQFLWLTSLVSKETTLPALYRTLEYVGAIEVETLEMSQGQKKSRIIAWTFLDRDEQEKWKRGR